MWVGIAMTNLYLGSVGMPSSLFQWVSAALYFSDGGVSPVLLMKVARAGLTVVTFLSWVVGARTSSFVGRALAGIRNGLTLRSVGSNSMSPLVLCLRQGWHAVCQRVKGSSVPVMGNASPWGFVHMG